MKNLSSNHTTIGRRRETKERQQKTFQAAVILFSRKDESCRQLLFRTPFLALTVLEQFDRKQRTTATCRYGTFRDWLDAHF
jgi:hypothetical protein